MQYEMKARPGTRFLTLLIAPNDLVAYKLDWLLDVNIYSEQ